jgi:uncharacterized repeat protein (TIGR03803 family)
MILSGHILYGVAGEGGTDNEGTVFALNLQTQILTALASFTGVNGAYPVPGLVLEGNTLYGATFGGGADDDGTLYSLNLNNDVVTTLASFNGSNGTEPEAGPILDGITLYGTTDRGGADGDGTVYAYDFEAAPEPSTWSMLLVGLGLLASVRRSCAELCYLDTLDPQHGLCNGPILAYSTKEACFLLGGIHPRTLQRATRRGLIKPIRAFRTLYWTRTELERFLKETI